MISRDNMMTPEELESNYEFKVTKKALTREFKWIIDVTTDFEQLNKYSLIFLDFVINPITLQKQYGWPIMWYVPYNIDLTSRPFEAPFLSGVFDVPYETTKKVVSSIEEMMLSIHKSIALPQELKLPRDRRFAIGSYIVSPEMLKSEDGYEPLLNKYVPVNR